MLRGTRIYTTAVIALIDFPACEKCSFSGFGMPDRLDAMSFTYSTILTVVRALRTRTYTRVYKCTNIIAYHSSALTHTCTNNEALHTKHFHCSEF